MTEDEIAEIAAELFEAGQSRTPIDPLSERYPDLDIASAYRVQSLQIADRVARGDHVVGFKIGLTSQAMRDQMGVHEPDFGHLLASTVVDRVVPLDRLIAPLVEPEIAVVLSTSLRGPGLMPNDVAAAIATVHPALEVVDSRIRGWRIRIFDTIADNASAGLVILGDPMPPGAIAIDELHCSMVVNSDAAVSGHACDTMGSPLAAVTWLANTLGTLGVELPAGSILLTGALTRAVRLTAATRIHADFGALGSIGAITS